MKTKIIITKTVDFIFGIVLIALALVGLFIFGITSDIDNLTISFLDSALGFRYISDGIDKIYIKEENKNGK